MKFFRKRTPLPGILTLFLATSAQAFELDGSAAFGFPRGELFDYSSGGLIVEGNLKVCFPGFLRVSGFATKLFADVSYSDLGLEEYVVPAEVGYSDVSLNVATDLYLIQTGMGLVLEGRQKIIRPYCTLSAGLVYYSNLSRIWSRNIVASAADELFSNEGTTWRVDAGGGIRIQLWGSEHANGTGFVNEFAGLFEAGYATGGRLNCLQIRSPSLLEGTLSWYNFKPRLESFYFRMGFALVL